MTNFPDRNYLERLVAHMRKKVGANQSLEEELLMVCNAAMNWVPDFVLDPNVEWRKEDVRVDQLWLTGTNPTWNRVIIEECERSPIRLREQMKADVETAKLFADAVWDGTPILIREEDGKQKVLEGMHRSVAAIRDGVVTLPAFVARLKPGTRPRPICEAHVVYDLLRAYHRGLNQDRAGLIGVLRFLRSSFGNVDALLRDRFTKSWVPSDEIQVIIQEALSEPE